MANPSHDKGDVELLPCPFCGCVAGIATGIFPCGAKEYIAACMDCDALIPHGWKRSDVADQWNRRATPPSPSTAPEAWVYECKQPGDDKDKWAEFFSRNKPSDAPYIRNARPLYGAALASRPRIKLDPELKAALEEAAKTGATSALMPDGGAVFINRGHDYGDNAHLECTACGGSGHIDDQRQIAVASRPAEVDDASAKAGAQVGVAQAETRMDTGFQPVVAPAPEVDDEGLPPLPEQHEELQARWRCDSCGGRGHDGELHYQGEWQPPEPYPCSDCDGAGQVAIEAYTAEQYRQGQRDAVAADRAREWFVVGGRRIGRTYMAKLAHDAARYRWLRESNNVEAVSILDMHSGDSMDARVDQAMGLAAAQPGTK